MGGLDLSALCGIPIESPPLGVESNFINPSSQANLPRIFTYMTLPPMVIFLGLRFYTRIKITRQVGIDDYLCALAAAALIAQTVLMFMMLGNPTGPHGWDIQVCQITVQYPKFSILQSILFPISAMFIKLAVLALYRRIFGPVRLANSLILSGMAFTAVFYLATIILFCAGCIPRAEDYPTGGWLSLNYDVRCAKLSAPVAAACGIVGAVLDCYILVIPLFFVWGLHMSTRHRIGVASIFFTGAIAVAFSIAGAYYRTLLIHNPGSDLSWRAMPIYAMNVAELNVAIACSCMPVIFVLFKGLKEKTVTWLSKLRSTSRRTKSSDQSTAVASNNVQKHYKMDNGGDVHRLMDLSGGTLTETPALADKVGHKRHMRTQTAESIDAVPLPLMQLEEDSYHGQLRGTYHPLTNASYQQAEVEHQAWVDAYHQQWSRGYREQWVQTHGHGTP